MPPLPAALAQPQQLFIDGHWQRAAAGGLIDVVNPADGEVFAQVAAGDAADVDQAVAAARRAFDHGPWRSMSPAARAGLMLKLAEAIDAHADELALLECLDNGKPLFLARILDVAGSAECLRYNAGWATKLGGETVQPSGPGEWHAYTLREPVGVVGAIVPWNFPLLMAVGKIAPALAAGCTVVLKPAEQTPLSAVRLGQLVAAVGFPAGVVNIVTGLGDTAGRALVAHPGVDKISFTGSTAVGKSIVHAAAHDMKRVTLELGGKSPTIVCADADLDAAIDGAARGIFFNAGQVCAAGSRLYVERAVYERVLEGVARKARELVIGPGVEPTTQLGPLVSQEQRSRVLGYVAAGREQGAQVVTGGAAVDRPGFFVQPTVLAHTRADMSVVRDEIFGPVLCAMPFDGDDLDGLLQQANHSPFGLSSGVWTRDIGKAHRLARRLQAGSVFVNATLGMDLALPFGGYKQSGWGRENGRVGVEAYTELKSVAVAL